VSWALLKSCFTCLTPPILLQLCLKIIISLYRCQDWKDIWICNVFLCADCFWQVVP
jgi:hypothetical protein